MSLGFGRRQVSVPLMNRNPKKLLIFGCGYIGSAVVVASRNRGWEVTALTRNPDTALVLRSNGCRVVLADLADQAWHSAISHEQDYVLNSVSSGGHGVDGYWHSYVEGTKSILAWAADGVAATFVYTGSTSVYPQHSGEVVDEDSTVGGGSAASEPLLEAERLVRTSNCFDRWFILRLAGIYGPKRHYLLDQLRAGATEFPGTGMHRLNLAFQEDIVSAILACFDAPAEIHRAVFNVAGDVAVPKSEVVNWLADETGVGRPVFVADAGERIPDVGRKRGRSGPVPDRVISNQRLKNTLGWTPRFPGYREGYERIFDLENPARED